MCRQAEVRRRDGLRTEGRSPYVGLRDSLPTFFFFPFYSRWTSSLPSCLWSQRIFPSLPGSRLAIFLSRCKFSTLTTRQPMVEFGLKKNVGAEKKNWGPKFFWGGRKSYLAAEQHITRRRRKKKKRGLSAWAPKNTTLGRLRGKGLEKRGKVSCGKR